MNIKLSELPVVGNIINSLNNDLEKYPLQKSALRLVNKVHGRLEVLGQTGQTEITLKDRPVIVVCNHPSDSDPIALIASMPEREDAHLIAVHTSLGLCGNLDKYMIPVYVGHHNIRNRNLLRNFLRIFNPIPIYSPQEEHKKNINSIKLAAKKIDAGGLILIFPGTGYAPHWYPGVGYLINNLRGNKNTYLVNAHIIGTSKLDLLRIVPGLGRIFHPVKITYSKPRLINDIRNLPPKDIKQILENEYHNWLKEAVAVH